MRVMMLHRWLGVVASILLATVAHAGSLAFWDFENATSVGGVSTSNALTTAPTISAFISQDGGGPAENFGPGIGVVFLTRFLGTYHPFIQLTTSQPLVLKDLSFVHYDNHNLGFPSYPSYFVQIQIDMGSGFVDVGAPVLLAPAGYGTTATVSLGNLPLAAGTHRIRWDPRGLAWPPDTNTEFFALNNVNLDGDAIVPAPAASTWGLATLAALLLLTGAGVVWGRRP